jgi:excisionase family DNA binding protein
MNDDSTRAQLRDTYRLWTAQEVAEMLGCCDETVYRLNRRKKLRALEHLRTLRFTTAAVEAFLRGSGK